MRRAPPPPYYQFAPATQMPTPGAMNMGFESEMMALRPWIGPAIGVGIQFATIANRQLFQAGSYAWATGLTSVVHGQSALQPLSNPYSS